MASAAQVTHCEGGQRLASQGVSRIVQWDLLQNAFPSLKQTNNCERVSGFSVGQPEGLVWVRLSPY